MRILILATDIYTRGGVARYTATLAAALSGLPAGVDVLPLLGEHGRASVIPAKAGIHFGDRCETEDITNVDSRLHGNDGCAECGAHILAPTADRLSAGMKIRHAVRALRQARSRYDFVICSHLSQSPIAATIGLRHGTPYMVVAHGSEAWGRLPILKRLAVRGARAVLAVSLYTARALAAVNRISPARVKVIYNAIPEELAQALASGRGDPRGRPGPQGPPLQPTLLSVASLKPEHAYKGVDTVIQSLPQIASAVPEVRYVVVGHGEDRVRLERLAFTVGVRDRVIFAGEVSDVQLANLLRTCDVFVLPSRAFRREGDRWQGEGFGRVYVEAALAGKPVVGSTEGGAAEAVLDGRTGLLVDPRSVTGVAMAAIRLLQAPDWAASLGVEGRRWALRRFTVAAMRRALARVLDEDLRLRESVVRCSWFFVRPNWTNSRRSAPIDNWQRTATDN